MNTDKPFDRPLRRRRELMKTPTRASVPPATSLKPVPQAVLVAARRTAADVAFESAYQAHSE